jgi:hypothetical protein
MTGEKLMDDLELLSKATEFTFLDMSPERRSISLPYIRRLTVNRTSRLDDTPSWAIRSEGSMCLNHHGEWEWEPQPSSRDDEFFARCRWPDLAEAVAFVTDHLARYPSGYKSE